MKCPKCSYLGFETGDRCKNCGYDFSLIAVGPTSTPMADAIIRTDDAETGAPELWLDRMDRSMDEASRPSAQDHLSGIISSPPSNTTAEHSLPLFNPDDPDDIPLIALPAAPRPPLSVRRTPEGPRLRAVPRMSRRAEPALNFREEPEDEERAAPQPLPARTHVDRSIPAPEGKREVGFRRLVAAVIDHALLLAIDLAVVYFTLRMAGLDAADVQALPIAPLVTFLGLVKVSYFTAFTAVGGQTIGKMALHIRVVGDEVPVDSGRAVRRTFAALLSTLPLGLGFLPAFFGTDRRALHDRLTHTRVIGLPSA
jgi:uncharacterized RDD family membrane protein YckC